VGGELAPAHLIAAVGVGGRGAGDEAAGGGDDDDDDGGATLGEADGGTSSEACGVD
jgi:hypothetical protein